MKVGTLATMVATLLIGFPIASMAGVAPDFDNDTVPDVLDNCVEAPNAGSASCDTDQDGYGNACDGDFNNNGSVSVTDFVSFFSPDLGGPDGGTGTDMNCNGTVTVTDFLPPYFSDQLGGSPGPSGLSCAGTVPCP